MRSDPLSFKPLDPGRVNPVDPVEMAYWCRELRCTEPELFRALVQVGEHVTELRSALARPQPALCETH